MAGTERVPVTCAAIGSVPALPVSWSLLGLRDIVLADQATGPRDNLPSPEAALRELLKEKAHGYTVFNRGGLAEYTAGAVSLRKGTSSAPLMDLLPAEWAQRHTPDNLLVSDAQREDWLHELGIDA